MKHVLSTLCVLLFPLLAQAGGADVVIENAAVRLVIGADGAARSLIHKSTGEECLAAEVRTPICAITQYRPYDNENFLIYPAKPRVFRPVGSNGAATGSMSGSRIPMTPPSSGST